MKTIIKKICFLYGVYHLGLTTLVRLFPTQMEWLAVRLDNYLEKSNQSRAQKKQDELREDLNLKL